MVDIPNANKSQAGPNYFFLLLIILIVIGGTCVYFYPYVKDTLFSADKKAPALRGKRPPTPISGKGWPSPSTTSTSPTYPSNART